MGRTSESGDKAKVWLCIAILWYPVDLKWKHFYALDQSNLVEAFTGRQHSLPDAQETAGRDAQTPQPHAPRWILRLSAQQSRINKQKIMIDNKQTKKTRHNT